MTLAPTIMQVFQWLLVIDQYVNILKVPISVYSQCNMYIFAYQWDGKGINQSLKNGLLPLKPLFPFNSLTIWLVFHIYTTCLDIIQPTNKAFRDDGVGQNNGIWGLDINVLSFK